MIEGLLILLILLFLLGLIALFNPWSAANRHRPRKLSNKPYWLDKRGY